VPEPEGVTDDSVEMMRYKLNQSVHAALDDLGFEKDDDGNYKGVFADKPVYPTVISLKAITAACDNSKPKAPLFPFPGTLKVGGHDGCSVVCDLLGVTLLALPCIRAPSTGSTTPSRRAARLRRLSCR
jgi:hypothetical protein